MNTTKRSILVFLLLALAACGTPPSPNTKPLFMMEQPVSNNQNFVNFSIDEITILGKPGDPVGMGEFRLLIIGADTDGRSSGLFCPGQEAIKVRTGDTVRSPCLFSPGFDEANVGDGIVLMVIVVDEDESSLGADLTYEIITGRLADALGKAVAKGAVKMGKYSTPVGIAVTILADFTAGKVKNWVEKADLIGVQGITLSQSDGWSAGKSTTVTSADGGIRFTYTVTRSTTNAPTSTARIVYVTSAVKASSTPRPTSRPAATSAPKMSEPEQFVRNYFKLVTVDRNYEHAWTLLTKGFKQKNSPGGYSEYVTFWNKIDRLEIHSINFYEHTSTSAKCEMNMTFYANDTSQTVTVKYHLIFDSSRNTWLFESP